VTANIFRYISNISTNHPPTQVRTMAYIIPGSIHHPVSRGSLCYWKLCSTTQINLIHLSIKLNHYRHRWF